MDKAKFCEWNVILLTLSYISGITWTELHYIMLIEIELPQWNNIMFC